MENNKREAGVLCHISSLTGKYGIGSLGKEAYKFAKKLVQSGVKYWQILPLVQTGFGDSPYSSVACDSGNPYFIDLPLLKKQGLLSSSDLKEAEAPPCAVDYGMLAEKRYAVLRKAFSNFFFDDNDFRAFVKSGAAEDYALFMTAKTVYGGSFDEWSKELKFRTPEALEALRTDYHEEYLFWQFLQYEFNLQWRALKEYCNKSGLKIIGDIPLYVAYDSADVWANPALFKLDKGLKPVKVAGVPPDYFSETGQLWGNPVYDWKAHEKDGYAWWRKRLAGALERYDVVRIDHFRGLDRYYEIPAGAENAIVGQWQDGPKEKLFEGLGCGGSVIAEDLGLVDDGVRSLLKRTGFPGMKVLLFAFDGNPNNDFLPKNITENSVCYTGTHDNDTVAGYVKSLATEDFIIFRSRVAAALEEENILVPLGESEGSFCDAFVQMALKSKSRIAVIPVQDLLGLDNGSRMNLPGSERGNWQFRMKKLPGSATMKKLKKYISVYGRI